MKLIVGLGNPGRKYDNTKHNVGFNVLDMYASKHGVTINKIKFKSLICEMNIGSEKIVLMKPQTYMNLSGEAVREAIAFYKLNPEDIIVIYDDIDFEVGRMKIRKQGSSGTHNGMRSLLFHIKSDKFPRIRIGIGKPSVMDLGDYVLTRFSTKEEKQIKEIFEKCVDAIDCMLSDGIDIAMNKFNI